MLKYNPKMLQIYLPVILTIVILASVGFAASASAHKTIKVECKDLKLKFEFSREVINALAIADHTELEDIEDDLSIGRQTVLENFDKILDKC